MRDINLPASGLKGDGSWDLRSSAKAQSVWRLSGQISITTSRLGNLVWEDPLLVAYNDCYIYDAAHLCLYYYFSTLFETDSVDPGTNCVLRNSMLNRKLDINCPFFK
ncbi:hypothetical protein OIDMADRAFT_19090 [Oidiodendron maius Zn]|uniref:Uncharacterized protein n=1 Tax=Oidiodendron maius (strain Zn) TaxID=913774 RepID=A0A0C3HCW0_OIDMZ|nr:hypothetical protein OIDMADRAFT_19090 [Oidiodendron maius Zn]